MATVTLPASMVPAAPAPAAAAPGLGDAAGPATGGPAPASFNETPAASAPIQLAFAAPADQPARPLTEAELAARAAATAAAAIETGLTTPARPS
jgi:hypothetical protein